MRKLQIVDEFREQAANSLFNRAQAMAISMRLLQLEIQDGENTAEDLKVLNAMLEKFDFKYLDETESRIDIILDNANVARITTQDILRAIDVVKFEVE